MHSSFQKTVTRKQQNQNKKPHNNKAKINQTKKTKKQQQTKQERKSKLKINKERPTQKCLIGAVTLVVHLSALYQC